MAIEILPENLRRRYHIEQRRNACAILQIDFPDELRDIIECLDAFELLRSEIEAGGGGKSKIAKRFDDFLWNKGWREKSIKVSRTIEAETIESETHKVDFHKGRIAVEVEWNNKDPFYSRDLNAFRLLHELNVISVGIMITRRDELQAIFNKLGVGKKYGASTTHWGKLTPRVQSGGAGSCPLLLIGITKHCYKDNVA